MYLVALGLLIQGDDPNMKPTFIYRSRTQDRWWQKQLYDNDILNRFLWHVKRMNDRCYIHINIIAIVVLTNCFIPKWMLIPWSGIIGELLFTGEFYCICAKSDMKAFEAPEGAAKSLINCSEVGTEDFKCVEFTRPLEPAHEDSVWG